MVTPSPLQTLPLHVVKLIVNHAVNCSRLVNSGIEANSNEWNTLLKPFLYTCRGFRAIAYLLYCSRSKLELADPSTYAEMRPCLFELGYRMNNNLGYPTHHLVKELDIELDEEGIYSGNALKKLSRVPYKGCAFPLARKITFLIVAEKDIRTRPWRIKTNIDAFVQRIKELAPLADDFTIQPNDLVHPEEGASEHIDYLITRLLQLAKRVDYCSFYSSHKPVRMDWEWIHDLVHIKYALASQDYSFIMLSLSIGTDHYECLRVLIQYDDGTYVSYPQLLALELLLSPDDEDPALVVFEGAVPFPSLRRLEFINPYPFGDDTPFRGNSATLEILKLTVDRLAAQVLIKHNVFTLVSHPNLWWVSTRYSDAVEPDMIGTAAEPIQFALNIGPGAPVREIGVSLTSSELVSKLSAARQHTCIRDLTLLWKNLELWDVIALLKALPLLRNLESSYPKLGALPAGVTRAQLPEYLRSKHYPLGR
ncbi:hypothetical protein H4S04_000021 [Coemansia sp. S16]|nr:hypothetical protein H4S04_000021 [Coemansia sp. S16]KAJ2068779.1 hypothetical protein GGI08_000691 [Coemansia sp. S2]